MQARGSAGLMPARGHQGGCGCRRVGLAAFCFLCRPLVVVVAATKKAMKREKGGSPAAGDLSKAHEGSGSRFDSVLSLELVTVHSLRPKKNERNPKYQRSFRRNHPEFGHACDIWRAKYIFLGQNYLSHNKPARHKCCVATRDTSNERGSLPLCRMMPSLLICGSE